MAEEAQAEKLQALRSDRSARQERKRLWRQWWGPVTLVLVAVLVIVGQRVRRAPSVQVAEVREASPGGEQTELAEAGYVASRRRSLVAPQVAGRLEEVRVEEGEAVEEAEVIACLDDRDARVALVRASMTQQLPLSYRPRIAAVPGVDAVPCATTRAASGRGGCPRVSRCWGWWRRGAPSSTPCAPDR